MVALQMLDAEGYTILDLLSIASRRLDDSLFAVRPAMNGSSTTR